MEEILVAIAKEILPVVPIENGAIQSVLENELSTQLNTGAFIRITELFTLSKT